MEFQIIVKTSQKQQEKSKTQKHDKNKTLDSKLTTTFDPGFAVSEVITPPRCSHKSSARRRLITSVTGLLYCGEATAGHKNKQTNNGKKEQKNKN